MVSEQSNAHVSFMVVHWNGCETTRRRGQTLIKRLRNVACVQSDILMKTNSGICLMISMIQRQKPGV